MDSSHKKIYPESQSKAWLSWLAKKMQAHSQTVFMIEGLQPDWLSSTKQQKLYANLFYLIFGWLIGMTGWTFWRNAGAVFNDQMAANLSGFPGVLWILVGIIWGFTIGRMDNWRRASSNSWLGFTGNSGVKTFMINLLLYLTIWMGYWAIFSLIYPSIFQDGMMQVLSSGFIIAAFTAFWGKRGGLSGEIYTVEALGWSWKRAWKSSLYGVFGAMVFSLIWYLFFAIYKDWTGTYYLFFIGGYFGVGMLVGLLFGGLIGQVVKVKTAANQGIRLSLRNGLIAGLLFGIVVGITIWIIYHFMPMMNVKRFGEYRPKALIAGWRFGSIIFWIAFFWYGMIEVVKHFLLRFLLRNNEGVPLKLAEFLDYATHDLHFLQKVGGGYIFIHRYVLEHFAGMKKEK